MERTQDYSGADSRQPRYLSIAQVAGETSCSEAFWRKAIFLRKIPFVKIGRNVRILREDLNRWLEARRQEPST